LGAARIVQALSEMGCALRLADRFACLTLAVTLSLFAAACGKTSEPPPPPAPASTPAPAPSAPATRGPVKIEMHDVQLHVDDGIVLHIARLRGDMVPLKPGQPPVFDDQRSYVLRVADADLSLDMASLTVLLNRHVFGYENAPLTDITVKVEDGRLKQKGKLHKGVTVPFTLEATVSATDDGRLRLHTESVSALGLPAKKLLDLFGLSLDDVVKIKEQRGVEIAGDDIVIDTGRVLPPPAIEGRLTRVDLVNGALHQTFGTPGQAPKAPLAPVETRARHYVYFSGNELRFGKLLMSDADLQLIDADERDPFDFFPAKYLTQLVAGYSKNTPSGGLRTYMPDYNDITPTTDLRPTRSRR
jgi:hypothetical protein